MLYVCVRDVMDVVFSVCIVTRGAVGSRVWVVLVFRHADVVCVYCVHHVAVFNAAFCMTFRLLMLVEDASGNHMEETYSRAGLMYVSFGSNVRPGTCGCVAMGSVVLFILMSRLLLYYAGSGVKSASFFFWIKCNIDLFCPGKNFM